MLILCDITTVNYWGAIAVHSMLAVRWGVFKFSLRAQIFTDVVCIGWPIISATVLLATGRLQAAGKGNFALSQITLILVAFIIGFKGGLPFGFIKPGTKSNPNKGWPEFPTCWGPNGFVTLVVLACIVLVLVYSVQVDHVLLYLLHLPCVCALSL